MVGSLALTRPNRRFALNYHGDVTPIHTLPFVLGRSDRSDLILSRPSVSRRHARITPGPTGLLIEDLASTNGLFLNGAQLFDPIELRPGDEIGLGDERLRVLELGSPGDPGSSGVRAKYLLVSPPSADGNALRELVTVLGAVDAALLSSHDASAERTFVAHIAGPVEEEARSGRLDAEIATRVGLLAVRLAEATGNSAWFDFVLRLYTHAGLDMPPMLLSSLYTLSRRLGGVDRSAVRQYARRLRSRGDLSSKRRLLLDRIEGLAGSGKRPRLVSHAR